jgi:hypothetical protein
MASARTQDRCSPESGLREGAIEDLDSLTIVGAACENRLPLALSVILVKYGVYYYTFQLISASGRRV